MASGMMPTRPDFRIDIVQSRQSTCCRVGEVAVSVNESNSIDLPMREAMVATPGLIEIPFTTSPHTPNAKSKLMQEP